MADLTLAASDLALHDQALTANTVQVVVITAPPGSSSNLARLFNRGAAPIFWRRGTLVSVGGANAYLLEPGASVDFRLPDLSDAKIALISASAPTFTVQRRESSEIYRAAPGAGGGGGGGSTDVSALSKETTQGNVLAALGASGQLHSDMGALHSDLGTLHVDLGPLATQTTLAAVLAKLPASPALDASVIAIRDSLNTGTAHTDSAAILAKLVTSPALDASVLAIRDVLATGVTHADLAAILAKLVTAPALDSTFTPTTNVGNSLGAVNANVQLTPGRKGTALIHVTGTFVATLALQGQVDGTNYVTMSSTPQFLNLATGAYTSTITAPGLYQTSVSGLAGARITATAYTSGAAIVSVSLTDGPAMVALDASLPAGPNAIGSVTVGSGSLANNVGKMVISDPGGSASASVKAGNLAAAAADLALVVSLSPNTPLGAVPIVSLNAVTAVSTGSPLDNIGTRKSHTMQVDVTTSAVGTGGSHTVLLEGSLDGTNYTSLGTVTPTSTSTTASDPTNHANVSVANVPYRYIRARSTTIPTGWTGTVTARVTSGV